MSEDTKVHNLRLVSKPEDRLKSCHKLLDECKTIMEAKGFNKVMVLMLDSDGEEYRYQFEDAELRNSEKVSLMEVVRSHMMKNFLG